jgi:hypothetical protein
MTPPLSRIMANIMKQLELQKTTSTTATYPYGNGNYTFTVKVNKNAYSTDSSVLFNLLVCGDNVTTPTYASIFATSKSGTRFYAQGSTGVKPYTGAAWTGTGDQICSSAAMTTVNGTSTTSYSTGAGYNSGDTTTGPWRTWTGGN